MKEEEEAIDKNNKNKTMMIGGHKRAKINKKLKCIKNIKQKKKKSKEIPTKINRKMIGILAKMINKKQAIRIRGQIKMMEQREQKELEEGHGNKHNRLNKRIRLVKKNKKIRRNKNKSK